MAVACRQHREGYYLPTSNYRQSYTSDIPWRWGTVGLFGHTRYDHEGGVRMAEVSRLFSLRHLQLGVAKILRSLLQAGAHFLSQALQLCRQHPNGGGYLTTDPICSRKEHVERRESKRLQTHSWRGGETGTGGSARATGKRLGKALVGYQPQVLEDWADGGARRLLDGEQRSAAVDAGEGGLTAKQFPEGRKK